MTSGGSKFDTDYPFTYGFGPLVTKVPAPRRQLGRAIGWHLMIKATKQPS